MPTPALFTVAALADALDLQLDQLVRIASDASTDNSTATRAVVTAPVAVA